MELGDLSRRLDVAANVRSHYERAVALKADHAGALRGLASCHPPCERAVALRHLDSLYAQDAQRWWAATRAVALLEDPEAGEHDATALSLWRERVRVARAGEAVVWEELTEGAWHDRVFPQDLSEFEREEFKAALVRSRPVRRAWLVRKELRTNPWRRCYVLLLECTRMPDDELRALMQFWEQSWALPGLVVAWPLIDEDQRTEAQRHAGMPVWTRGSR